MLDPEEQKTDSFDYDTNIKGLSEMPSISEADSSIISNGVLQFVIATGLYVVFIVFRSKAPWLYYPNSDNRKKHPCSAYKGYFSWLTPLVTIKDTKMLGMVGLDGFMLLQTIKLLYRVFFIGSVFLCPLLFTIYYKKTVKSHDQVFEKLAVSGIKDFKVYYFLLFLIYLMTFCIFYLIFIYYKRYITLRQLYLISPASLTSVTTLKMISKDLKSDEDSIEFVNMPSTTVIFDRLPGSLKNDSEVFSYVKALGIGEVKNAVLIQNTYDLQKLYEERDILLQDIEKEINSSFERIKAHYQENYIQMEDSFKETYLQTLEQSVDRVFKNMKFKMDEKISLLEIFQKKGKSFLTMATEESSYLDVYLEKLSDCNKEILREKERLENDKISSSEVINLNKRENTFFIKTDISEDVSFFSVKHLLNFKKFKRLFTLDLPLHRKKAFVTFGSYKDAGILRQSQIGTRVFSPVARAAPAQNDIIWKNIGRGEISCFLSQVCSSFAYLAINIVFYYAFSMIVNMLKINGNSNNFILQWIKSSPRIKPIYDGIIGPLVYNILLLLVPIILSTFINLEGIFSFSLFQIRLMYLFSMFLFFNAFLSFFFNTDFIKTLRNIINEKKTLDEALSDFGENIVKSSVFFFNTVIQKLFVGTALTFFKPVPFIMNFILNPFVLKTRRQIEQAKFSPPLDFGNIIPNLLLVFPMALSYAIVCPPLLIVGFFFYFCNYFAYKNELVYTSRNPYESGGVFWMTSAKFLIMSVVSFQVITAATLYANEFKIIKYLVLPIFIFDYFFYRSLESIFYRSCNDYPLNEPEEEFLDHFSVEVIHQRKMLLDSWEENENEEDENKVPITELGMSDVDICSNKSYYKDPSAVGNYSEIFLPDKFFSTVHFLRTFDRKNKMGFNASGDKYNEEEEIIKE